MNPRSAPPLPLSPHHVVISFVFPSLNPFKFKFPSVSRLGPQLLANLFPLLHHAASPAQLNMPFYYYIIRFSCPVPFLFEFAFFFFLAQLFRTMSSYSPHLYHTEDVNALSPQYVCFNAWCLCTFPSGRPRPTVGGLAGATVKSTLFIDAFY